MGRIPAMPTFPISSHAGATMILSYSVVVLLLNSSKVRTDYRLLTERISSFLYGGAILAESSSQVRHIDSPTSMHFGEVALNQSP